MDTTQKWRSLTLDHADIVGAVPDGEGDGPLVPLDQLHHLRLLQGRHPAADDRLTQTGHVQQHLLQLHLQLQCMGLWGVGGWGMGRSTGQIQVHNWPSLVHCGGQRKTQPGPALSTHTREGNLALLGHFPARLL